MREEVKEWSDIADDYHDGLVLGNGFSIAVSEKFDYYSLYQKALDSEYLMGASKNLFEDLQQQDFEAVLQALSTAEKVNKHLKMDSAEIVELYEEIRHVLITTVREVHVDYASVHSDLLAAGDFMRRFKIIASLNYDLLIYWALMLSNDVKNGHRFKDGFTEEENTFRKNGRNFLLLSVLRKRLHLWSIHTEISFSRLEQMGKPKNKHQIVTQICLIFLLTNGEQRNHCPYLSVRENHETRRPQSLIMIISVLSMIVFCQKLDRALFFYGWSFSENDIHILDAIFRGEVAKCAVAVSPDSNKYREKMERIRRLIVERQPDAKIDFFKRGSSGCWVNK
jgi:hypothetical protein